MTRRRRARWRRWRNAHARALALSVSHDPLTYCDDPYITAADFREALSDPDGYQPGLWREQQRRADALYDEGCL